MGFDYDHGDAHRRVKLRTRVPPSSQWLEQELVL